MGIHRTAVHPSSYNLGHHPCIKIWVGTMIGMEIWNTFGYSLSLLAAENKDIGAAWHMLLTEV